MVKRLQQVLSNRLAWIFLVGLISIAGTFLVLYGTVWGAALSDDSFHYISSARNLLAGRGFDLTTMYPPGLPLLLSALGLLKIDPLVSIRWVNALLFGVNIFLLAWLARSSTNSPVFSILAALLASISTTLIVVHSWAMSEALYITFNLLGLLVISSGRKKGFQGIPIFSGLLFGLAAATRYIGISLLLAGGIFWLVESGKRNQERIRNAFLFSIAGIIPLLLWVIRNLAITGQPINRSIELHPLLGQWWIQALNTMLLWLAPGRFVHDKELIWLGMIGLLLVAWLGVLRFREKIRFTGFWRAFYQNKTAFLVSLSILAYWVILLVSRSIYENAIPMDERLLSPLLVLGLILLIWLFAKVWERGKWIERSLIVAVILVMIITNFTRSVQTVRSYHELGRGYASARDHISETYAYLRKHPEIPVYSNAAAAIYFWTGHVTYSIPVPEKIPAMKEDMRQTGAYLVVFYSIPLELYGTTEAEITQDLVEQIRLSEATIYRAP